MPKCSFCGEDYDVPRGLTYVLLNGEVLYFCSSKCQKNYKMGRRGDKQNWVRKVKKLKDRENEKTDKVEKKNEKIVDESKKKVENKDKKKTN